jgi:hypothetical protein
MLTRRNFVQNSLAAGGSLALAAELWASPDIPDTFDRCEDAIGGVQWNASRSPGRCVRLHRAVLQSTASAFDARAGKSGSIRKS